MINKELKLIQAEELALRKVQAKQELSGVMSQIKSCEDKEYLTFLKVLGIISLKLKRSMFKFNDLEDEFENYCYHQNSIDISLRKCLNLCIMRSSFDYKVDNSQTLSLNGYCGIRVDTYGNGDWNRCHISIRFPKELSEL